MITLLFAAVWWSLIAWAAILAAVIGRVAWVLFRDWREARRPVFVPVGWEREVFDRETARGNGLRSAPPKGTGLATWSPESGQSGVNPNDQRRR